MVTKVSIFVTANFIVDFYRFLMGGTSQLSPNSVSLHCESRARASSIPSEYGVKTDDISPISPALLLQYPSILGDTKEAGPQSRTSLFTCPPLGFFLHVIEQKDFAVGVAAFLKMKMTGRVVFSKKEMPQWKAARRVGLVFENKKNNREIFLKSYKAFRGPKIRLSQNDISVQNIVAAVEAVMVQYSMKVHVSEARDNCVTRKGLNNREVTSSLHKNGIALSVLAMKTKRSKSTCSRARRAIEKAGYGYFERQRVVLNYAAGDERQRVLPDDHGDYFKDGVMVKTGFIWATKADGVLMKELTAKAVVNYFSFSYRDGKRKPAKTDVCQPQYPRSWYRD